MLKPSFPSLVLLNSSSSPLRNPPGTRRNHQIESAAMPWEPKNGFVAEGLGLLAIHEPGDIVRCNNIPRDVIPFARAALDSLRGLERDWLHFWIEDEARHGSSWLCEYLPPFSILKCTDLLNKLWGWDRLLVYDFGCEFYDPSHMPLYESYLDTFYHSNHHHNNGTNAILECLEREKALSSKWKAKKGKVLCFSMELSKDIQECMSNLVNNAGSESRQPFSTYAAACIMKEAELMIEWLSQESPVPFEEEEYDTSDEIRQLALDLAMFEGNWNTHAAAVLLGITKEAEFLLKSVKPGCLVSTDISMHIRTHASNFLHDKYCELDWAAELTLGVSESAAELTLGVSDEMTSATEINQLTWDNTESVNFRKNEMQEQCVSNTIIDPELMSRLVQFNLADEPS